MTAEQKQQIKSHHDKIIAEKGYRVNAWLPILEDPAPRSIEEIKGRVSVMTALINIAFEAPTHIIKNWIEKNDLNKHLSKSEIGILNKTSKELTEFEIEALRWYLESLWAMLWVLKMIDNLEAEKHVGDNLASLTPNLQHNENNEKIAQQQHLQTELDIYIMLDYYYRLHWYCVNERLPGRQAKLNEGLIYERRKALEWAIDKQSDWDNIEMST